MAARARTQGTSCCALTKIGLLGLVNPMWKMQRVRGINRDVDACVDGLSSIAGDIAEVLDTLRHAMMPIENGEVQ